ncbi:MAG TPA: trimethylamine methyltransferase family protein, partial [Anaerolineae bacterium]|nr:trimethylamine methyltransferase family protein [Anaerolineae bacterium]
MNTLAFPHLAMLSQEQCETIHRASLEILRRSGVRVFHDGALELLRSTDAVITDGNLVRFPPGLVEWAFRQAPSRITLCRRGSGQVGAPLEGHEVSFGPGSDCPNYLDPRSGQRRPFTAADVIDCIHLVDALPELSFCMSMGIPSDPASEALLSANAYRQQFALMVEHTTKPIVFVTADRASCQRAIDMAAAAAGGLEALVEQQHILLYSEPSSPLKQSQTAVDKLLLMADNKLPVVHSPGPQMGATAPIT